jgi:hypothetical protein
MMEVQTEPRKHFAGEDRGEEAYRDVSRAAVAALVLGIAAPLVLVSPLLAVVPLLAILFALIALRGIRASGGQLVGWLPAVIGLCLALFSLGANASWSLSRRAYLETQSRRFADEWLAILARGDQQLAHQFHLTPLERLSDPRALATFYKTQPEAAKSLQQMMTGEALAEFVLQGPSVKYHFDSVVSQDREGLLDELVLKYTYDRPHKPPRDIWITVKLYVDEHGKSGWQIRTVDASDPTT